MKISKLQLKALVISFGIMVNAEVNAADTNSAMNVPDEVSWQLFLEVNAKAQTSGNNNALFETWASDHDTFQLKPKPWPVKAAPLQLKTPALLEAKHASLKNSKIKVQVVPGASSSTPSEETRRNKPAYDFIIENNLYKRSGLQAAFGTVINFPIDSIEVKANWYPVVSEKDSSKSGIPGYDGPPSEASKIYHVNTASDGKQYALVAMHVISKLVPNWTWATFEHKNNLGRCDIIGCKDLFGAIPTSVTPNQNPGQSYPDCKKSPALQAMFAKANIDPSYQNYCLKGSQTDYTTATGQAVRLGNSVTESGFVNQSSCMTCHSRAAFDSTGKGTTFAGFDPFTQIAPIGTPDPSWFFSSQSGNPPYFPIFVDQTDLQQLATPVDFIWSIPFCAVDDTVTPAKPSHCANK